jgi:hypothetical protein
LLLFLCCIDIRVCGLLVRITLGRHLFLLSFRLSHVGVLGSIPLFPVSLGLGIMLLLVALVCGFVASACASDASAAVVAFSTFVAFLSAVACADA